MKQIYDRVSFVTSEKITKHYSTSFSFGILFLQPALRKHIYAIYGFVRLADEIVDTFHDFDKENLLKEFESDTYLAIENKISLNPVLHAFQETVNQYHIDLHLIDAFFKSMYVDLYKQEHNVASYEEYIYGSAEVVGLMCLKVFCGGNNEIFTSLKPYAQSLGAAFQKVNFLRDIKADYEQLHRIYFPGIDFEHMTETEKREIEEDISKDFAQAFIGIKKLPLSSRTGVFLAYEYYRLLFLKIKRQPADKILQLRIRIPNFIKLLIMAKVVLKRKLRVV